MASATCVNSSDSLGFSFLPRRLSSAHHPRPSSADDADSSLDPISISDDDFEFRLEDPVTIIPADELFSDGKLQITTTFSSSKKDVILNEEPKTMSSSSQISNTNITTCTDSYLFSPKAPRCSSRWKEILGLKKYTQSQNQSQTTKTTSFKHFLHRNSRSSSNSSCSSNSNSNSSSDQSLNCPLLDSNSNSSNKDFIEFYDAVSISTSRLSLSSSPTSSSSNYPFGSTDKPDPNPFVLNRNPNMKMLKSKTENGNGNGNVRVGRSPVRRAVGENPAAAGVSSRGVSVDSPRLNSSGKIVFQSLERSSSSPSSFNGGPRYKHRGMERSYSANVRVTPVLNVPVCSLPKSVFGLGQLFSSSPQKRENGSGKVQGNLSRTRADRT